LTRSPSITIIHHDLRDAVVLAGFRSEWRPASGRNRGRLQIGNSGRLRRNAHIRLTVPFGQLETRPRISPEDQESLLRANRARYASGAEALVVGIRAAPEGGLGQPELL
jgi:hypothetical protein